MIGLLGVKRNTPLEVREKLIITYKNHDVYIKKLLESFKEIVILGTCNRTEIYFNVFDLNDEEILKKIFEVLNWEIDYKKYIFISKNKRAYTHLFEVCSGFHSKIIGEDQILGQVKNAYDEALKRKALAFELQRLFEQSLSCGKKFKSMVRLYEIPVSSASIVVNQSINKGCSTYMILGYGEVGRLALKYLLSHKVKKIYLVVRNMGNIRTNNEIEDNRVEVISFDDKNKYINNTDCVIGCTSAPHIIVNINDINEKGRKLYMYDLAMPRDFDEKISYLHRTEVYNIDEISHMNDENKKMRRKRMEENKCILDEYLNKYEEWIKLREVVPNIQYLKFLGKNISEKRINTFINKSNSKDHIMLAKQMIESASNFYINNAIDLLKEETLKGSGDECIKIIEKIFKLKK